MKKAASVLILLSLVSVLHAHLISPTPNGAILPHKTAALFVAGKLPIDEESAPRDVDASAGFGLFNRFDIEFISYFGSAFALNLNILAIEETRIKPRVAFGIENIALDSYISSFGKGTDTRWEQTVYETRNPERFSLYGLVGKEIGISDFSVGIGRGRFVGYGTWTRMLNTDFYSDETHSDAFGIFLEWQLFDIMGAKPYFSIDGRNYAYGIRFDHRFFSIAGGVMTPNSLQGDDAKQSIFTVGMGLYTKQIFGEHRISEIGILKGRVYDEKTVKSLSAMVTISGPGDFYTTLDAPNGSYTIELKEGIYDVHIAVDGYYWKEKTVNVAAGGILYCNFKLKKQPKTILEPEE
jgi:hypothetical protein